MLMQFYSLWI